MIDKNLRNKILKKIKPSQKEALNFEKEVFNFIEILKESSKKLGFENDFFLGGSFGKNTYLTQNFDVDIFCRFNRKKYEDKSLSNNLKKILDYSKIKYKKEKGSRDYYRVEYNKGAVTSQASSVPFFPEGKKGKINIVFELVPIFNITKNSEAENSTDFSPFHVEFLKNAEKKNKNLCDEIRLAKQFFKAHNLYGAESYIGGFSGHVIDNLIIYYGSLENLLKEAKNWKDSFFLDVNNNYKNKTDAMKKIEGDKISNLILVDPILKTRNAARAITNQKYNEFLFIVNNFSKFSDKDFIVKKILIKEKINIAKKFANKNNLNILIYNFDFSVENDSCDIIGSKLLKLFKKIEVYFEELDFPIFKSDFQISFDENKSVFIYFLENVQISNLKKVIGPKVYMELAVKKFLENKSDFFIQEDRVMIYKKRKITKLSQISNMKLKDLKIFFEKDLSFIKSFKKL